MKQTNECFVVLCQTFSASVAVPAPACDSLIEAKITVTCCERLKQTVHHKNNFAIYWIVIPTLRPRDHCATPWQLLVGRGKCAFSNGVLLQKGACDYLDCTLPANIHFLTTEQEWNLKKAEMECLTAEANTQLLPWSQRGLCFCWVQCLQTNWCLAYDSKKNTRQMCSDTDVDLYLQTKGEKWWRHRHRQTDWPEMKKTHHPRSWTLSVLRGWSVSLTCTHIMSDMSRCPFEKCSCQAESPHLVVMWPFDPSHKPVPYPTSLHTQWSSLTDTVPTLKWACVCGSEYTCLCH